MFVYFMHEVAYRYRVLNTRRIHSREWKYENKIIALQWQLVPVVGPCAPLFCQLFGWIMVWFSANAFKIDSLDLWIWQMNAWPWPMKNSIKFSTTFDGRWNSGIDTRLHKSNAELSLADYTDIPFQCKWIYCVHKRETLSAEVTETVLRPIPFSVVYWLQTYH